MPLHPQARALLETMAAQKGRPVEELPPEESRKNFIARIPLYGKAPDLHQIEDRAIAGRLAIRIYRPSAAKKLPVVMFFHGGGWVLGGIETHDILCRRLAQASECAFISVEYRLAPENKFPAALDDCFGATEYVLEHAEGFGVDPARIAVCGDSAGGNLAAAVALQARDQEGPKIHSQWLFYPVIAPNFMTASYKAYAEGYGLTRAGMKWFWDQYVPNPLDRHNPLASPSKAKTLAGLPPAHIITAECDVLCGEGEGFAAALQSANVPTILRRYDGTFHGFLHFPERLDGAKRAIAEIGQDMKKQLRPA